MDKRLITAKKLAYTGIAILALLVLALAICEPLYMVFISSIM